jgi:hypothetical protein
MIGSYVQKLYSMMPQTKMLLIHNGLTLEEYFFGGLGVYFALTSRKLQSPRNLKHLLVCQSLQVLRFQVQ